MKKKLKTIIVYMLTGNGKRTKIHEISFTRGALSWKDKPLSYSWVKNEV